MNCQKTEHFALKITKKIKIFCMQPLKYNASKIGENDQNNFD